MVELGRSSRNDAVAWSDFDADEYWKFNFAAVLPEDAQIIQYASRFLIEACKAPKRFETAVDVGAGTNLYPGLLMLPWAKHITFTEYAESNVDWLKKHLVKTPEAWRWQPFWDLVTGQQYYRDVADPRRELAEAHEVLRGSIFDLPRRTWDLGSMFFVADGITDDEAEFEAAVRAFLGSLKPDSPFLMAFIEGSSGYEVNGVRFPSVRVTMGSLEALLAGLPVKVDGLLRTDNRFPALRPGYDAMLLVTGWVNTSAGVGRKIAAASAGVRGKELYTGRMNASADGLREAAAAAAVVRDKEEVAEFDVFLCHSWGDKPAVRRLAQQLRERGLRPWLDEEQLRPGMPWQPVLEEVISSIPAAAVIVGPQGVGPWQNQELNAFIRQFIRRRCPVVPVLLPGARRLNLPVFLDGLTWVDLTMTEPDPLDLLYWGITGRQPGR
jgi:TIR domain-containing protein/NNMT/PNMT/TEMT family protein